MKKPYKRILIISIVLFVVAILIFVPPKRSLPSILIDYAQGFAYAPVRGADSFYVNYHVLNAYKYFLNNDEFADAYRIMKSSNNWHKFTKSDLKAFEFWFMETELIKGLIYLDKDNIQLSKIDIESAYYCMYDVEYNEFIQPKDEKHWSRYLIFILDCTKHNYYCLYRVN